MNAVYTSVDHHVTSMKKKVESKLKIMEELHANMRFLNKLITKLYSKNLQYYLPLLEKRWTTIKMRLESLLFQHHLNEPIPTAIDSSTAPHLLISLKSILKVLFTKYDAAATAHQDKLIRQFVQQRNEDYYDNQSHMIDSFLEWPKHSIVINHMLVTNDDTQELLLTDPDEIKQATISHFQTCAGGVHKEKPIPLAWREQYSPKQEIDPSIYNQLLSPISTEE